MVSDNKFILYGDLNQDLHIYPKINGIKFIMTTDPKWLKITSLVNFKKRLEADFWPVNDKTGGFIK